MDPVKTLTDEHRLIEKVLDAVEAFSAQPRTGTEEDKAELGRFVDFIRHFADRLHHGKEEDILFAEMVMAGFPKQGGPVGAMLEEHEMGRAHVRVLADLTEMSEPWADLDKRRLADATYGFATLLRHHILKEDTVFYPLAKTHLPPQTLDVMGRRFDEFEAKNAAERERLTKLAEELAARYSG